MDCLDYGINYFVSIEIMAGDKLIGIQDVGYCFLHSGTPYNRDYAVKGSDFMFAFYRHEARVDHTHLKITYSSRAI